MDRISYYKIQKSSTTCCTRYAITGVRNEGAGYMIASAGIKSDEMQRNRKGTAHTEQREWRKGERCSVNILCHCFDVQTKGKCCPFNTFTNSSFHFPFTPACAKLSKKMKLTATFHMACIQSADTAELN